jgi:predicted metal-dependent enzyme (double-stranded beta helix superfamily)
MAYTLDQFASDCRTALKADPGPKGREKVRQAVERALRDKEFVAKHLGPKEDSQRKILYEDPDLKFCILAHVYHGARNSPPHDHGPSWAIYGQAEGVTEMTDWRLIERPRDGRPGKAGKVRSYNLEPGVAHLYNEGDLHSPRRADTTRLIRIEGINLEPIKRDKYEPA